MIFFASSAAQNKTGLVGLAAFFLQLNNCYVKRGIYFTPVFLEDMPDADAARRELAVSSLAIFVFDIEESDTYLSETLNAARDAYNQTGKPRIAIYEEQSPDVSGHQSVVINEAAQHRGKTSSPAAGSDFYTRKYSHIDTLKLGILMHIKQLDIPGVDIKLEGGKAWQGNDILMSLDNAESVARFETLQQLREKHAECENRYYAARTRYTENPDDTDVYKEFFDASKEHNDALQEIRDIEAGLYQMIEGMYEQTDRGKLSKRQAEGYQLTEKGLLREARDILDYYGIVSESRRDEEAADHASQRAQVHVNEQLQLKDINAALLDWEGVDACYKEAVRLEERHNLPKKATLDFVEFLVEQNRHTEAAEIGEKLLYRYNSPGSGASEQDRSLLYDTLGLAYTFTQRLAEAEEMLTASMNLRLGRTDGEDNNIEAEIAKAYQSLGNLYTYSMRHAEAAELLEESMEIRKRLAEQDPGSYTEKLGDSYYNLALAYDGVGKHDEALESNRLAAEIYEELASKKPGIFDYELASLHQNMGIPYARLQRYEEAETEIKQALQIRRELAYRNPDKYEVDLAKTYRFLGGLYGILQSRYAEGESYCKADVEICRRLAERDHDAYIYELGNSDCTIGKVYKNMERFAEAEKHLSLALQSFGKCDVSSPLIKNEIAEIHELLEDINKPKRLQEGELFKFTPEEKELTVLLTEGMSQREICRKLNLTALEFSRRINTIREKVSGMAPPDPVIEAVAREHKLTRREADILRYLRKNNGNDVIAAELYLSEETVRIHVRNVLKKLKLDSRQHVPAWLDNYSVEGGGN